MSLLLLAAYPWTQYFNTGLVEELNYRADEIKPHELSDFLYLVLKGVLTIATLVIYQTILNYIPDQNQSPVHICP